MEGCSSGSGIPMDYDMRKVDDLSSLEGKQVLKFSDLSPGTVRGALCPVFYTGMEG